eukprot:119069-Hanusia_phi.AAC.3
MEEVEQLLAEAERMEQEGEMEQGHEDEDEDEEFEDDFESASESEGGSEHDLYNGVSFHQIPSNRDEYDYDEEFESDTEEQKDAQKHKISKPVVVDETFHKLDDTEKRNVVMEQLKMIQSTWMVEGSMQQKIYKVAVNQMALSVVEDILRKVFDVFDRASIENDAMESTMAAQNARFQQVDFVLLARERLLTFLQLREAELRVLETKKQALEIEKKKEEEQKRLDEKYRERAKQMARLHKEAIKARQEDVHNYIEKTKVMKAKKVQEKEAEIEKFRKNIQETKEKSVKQRSELFELIATKKEEAEFASASLQEETQNREAFRSFQQNVAVKHMENFLRKREKGRLQQKKEFRKALHTIQMVDKEIEKAVQRNKQANTDNRTRRKQDQSRKVKKIHERMGTAESSQTSKHLQMSLNSYFNSSVKEVVFPEINSTSSSDDGNLSLPEYLQKSYSKLLSGGSKGIKARDLFESLLNFDKTVSKENLKSLVIDLSDGFWRLLDEEGFVAVGVRVMKIIKKENKGGSRQVQELSSLQNPKEDFKFPKHELEVHLQETCESEEGQAKELERLAWEASEIKRTRRKKRVEPNVQVSDRSSVREAEEPKPVSEMGFGAMGSHTYSEGEEEDSSKTNEEAATSKTDEEATRDENLPTDGAKSVGTSIFSLPSVQPAPSIPSHDSLAPTGMEEAKQEVVPPISKFSFKPKTTKLRPF